MKYNAFLNGTGCEDIDCLLEVGAKELLDLYESANAAPSYWGWLPVIDGVSVTEFFLNLFESKLFNNNVPIIIGTNREEAAGYMNIPSNNLTEGEFESLIQTYSPMSTEELTELKQLYDPQVYSYPAELGEYSIWAWMYARAQTDMMVTAELGLPGHCQDRWLARKLLEGGSKSVYMYQWAHTPNTVSEVFAAHGYEPFNVYNMLVYPIWKAQQTGNLTYIDDATAARVKMGRAMSAYWSSFAVSGDPSTTRDESELGMVQWPKFTTEQELTFMLEDDSKGGLRVEQHLLKEQCDWHLQYANSVGEYLPLKSEILMTSSATKHSMLMMLMTLMTLIQ
jgi:carboxylesterase type B